MGALFSADNKLAEKGLKAASEWQGDKAALLKNGDKLASAWIINFEDSDSAGLFAKVYGELLSKDKNRASDSFIVKLERSSVKITIFE